MDAYRAEIAGATQWVASRAKSTVRYLSELGPRKGSARKRRRNPAIQLKSYLLQEAEATAREAKIAWLEANGMRVTSLQHDGVMASGTVGQEQIEKGTSEAASLACGFEVPW